VLTVDARPVSVPTSADTLVQCERAPHIRLTLTSFLFFAKAGILLSSVEQSM
jgi:hypothetical protein